MRKITGFQLLLLNLPGKGPVEGSGIQVPIVKTTCQALGNRTLSNSSWTVNGNHSSTGWNGLLLLITKNFKSIINVT